MSRVLLTGGAGFIGSHVADEFIAKVAKTYASFARQAKGAAA